eukprot:COSAG02_NODE_81_length_39811_cov_51.728898_20_plen_314_part_00
MEVRSFLLVLRDSLSAPFFDSYCDSRPPLAEHQALHDCRYVGIISTDTEYGKDMATSIKEGWLNMNPEHRQEYYQIVDVDADETRGEKPLETSIAEAMNILDQGTSQAVTRVVVVTGHTDQVAEMLVAIAKENHGGTVDKTVYVSTTDSVPIPAAGWPENMRSGIFCIIVAAPDLSRQPESYDYLQVWKNRARRYLGYQPHDSDGNRDTIHTYSWNTHDAVITIASAYHQIKEQGVSGTLRDWIEQTSPSFYGGPTWSSQGKVGVSGPVEMDRESHDRRNANFALMNLQNGTLLSYAKHSLLPNQHCSANTEV